MGAEPSSTSLLELNCDGKKNVVFGQIEWIDDSKKWQHKKLTEHDV